MLIGERPNEASSSTASFGISSECCDWVELLSPKGEIEAASMLCSAEADKIEVPPLRPNECSVLRMVDASDRVEVDEDKEDSECSEVLLVSHNLCCGCAAAQQLC